MDELRLSPLDKRRFQDFEHLLSGKEFGGCYCAVWTNHDPSWEERCKTRPQENLDHTRGRVLAGKHLGFLVVRDYDGAVVAWTGAGPKSAFPLLQTRPASGTGPGGDGVWSVACLSIAYSYRGLGYARRIVEALVEEARRQGARTIEAYPIDPSGDDNAFRGSKALYEALGFSVAAREQEGATSYFRMEKSLHAA